MSQQVAQSILTVAQLNRFIKFQIESDPKFKSCLVSGEISNFKYHTSGHMYFTLKDETSRIRAVMFQGRNRFLKFRPEDGMKVICQGSVGVFERDGQYQLYIDTMQPDGLGDLYIAFEQLRDRLQSEGLFAEGRKKSLPSYPKRIGVVTSPTGAVIRDICTTIQRRFPLAQVILSPALVQGPEAAPTLVSALSRLETMNPAVDVIIIGRGGGSLEELWPFNEESVVRAVANCPIPIISAVGHETDVTLCDFAADIRAATPTAAAELAVPDKQELQEWLDEVLFRSRQIVRRKVVDSRRTLLQLATRPVLSRPESLVDRRRQAVDYLENLLSRNISRPLQRADKQWQILRDRLQKVMPQKRIADEKTELLHLEQKVGQLAERKLHRLNIEIERLTSSLVALNPMAVLQRGYSILRREDGKVITKKDDLPIGSYAQVQLADGSIRVRREDDWVDEQIRLDI
ncbi:exodeoxyribonuclease VII large subunit [Alicyclobacillus sp. TC]|uniref:exodeoxyribonuclease VII large subunit n=1 Tax=Alicyclobacillus sp. TC TaxID=2606450 RepID=UPI001EE49DB9|nr:exodeoxyribonuclease VII large subunit [Alicyclobacillus sp. TC]